MAVLHDFRILYHMLLKPLRGADHAARLESFYAGQAEGYDSFRERLLQGRREMYGQIPAPPGGIWVDMGGGTGSNLEFIADLPSLRKVYLVDLAPSLLDVAKERIARRGWKNVEAVRADAATFRPVEDAADVVTFSYSLTMIPDWFAAIDRARAMLKPGGLLGAVDFFVTRKHALDNAPRHSWFTRTFWPTWFAGDNVFLSADHVPYLCRHFEPLAFTSCRARIPYLPLLLAPYYTFVGRKATSESTPDPWR